MFDVMLDQGAYMPTRAHDMDAGLDLRAREDKRIPAHGAVDFETGVHIMIPFGAVGEIKAKSGLSSGTKSSRRALLTPGIQGRYMSDLSTWATMTTRSSAATRSRNWSSSRVCWIRCSWLTLCRRRRAETALLVRQGGEAQ